VTPTLLLSENWSGATSKARDPYGNVITEIDEPAGWRYFARDGGGYFRPEMLRIDATNPNYLTPVRRVNVDGFSLKAFKQWGKIDAGYYRQLTIPAGMAKSNKIRMVPIVTPARPWLEKIPLGITPQGFRSGWDRARVKAKITDATIHDLRRSCGTMLIRAGVDLYIVSKILGHSSTAVTQQRYAHLATKQLHQGMRKAFG
jgi:integrase